MPDDFFDSSAPSGTWGAPIASPAAFAPAAEDGLYEARRLADGNPSAWIYQSIASVFEGMLQATADGHRPKPNDRQTIQSMVPIIRSQAGDADPALLRLLDSLYAYFLEWPAVVEPSVDADVDQDAAGSQPLLASFEMVITTIHALRGDIKQPPGSEQRPRGARFADRPRRWATRSGRRIRNWDRCSRQSGCGQNCASFLIRALPGASRSWGRGGSLFDTFPTTPTV